MSDRLSNLNQKDTSGNIQPYSRFVKSLQFILPIGALLLIGLIIIWPQITRIETEPLNERDIQALREAETNNTLLNPVFNTLDGKGNAVLISAETASQNRNDKDSVKLLNPSASMKDSNQTLEFQANEGTYNQTTKTLNLENKVVLKDDQNNILETEQLTANIEKNIATSNKPARLTTEKGYIEGQSVIIDQENQTTIFKGPAKAVINR